MGKAQSDRHDNEKLFKVIGILIEQPQVPRLLHDYLFNEQWLDKPLTYDGGLQIINNEDIRQVILFTLAKELSQIRERLIAEKKEVI